MKKKSNAKSAAYFCVILILVLLILFSGLKILESTVLHSGQESTDTSETKIISRNGIDYYPRQDITAVLLMGIDQDGPVKDSGSYNNSGAADMVTLVIFDETNETTSVLCLNRDTMLEMPVLGIGGKQAGTIYGQLALAHTYGSGLEDSCENVKTAVSDFLYGINIDYYISMNMDAVAILNDAVGGVTVNVVDDFSKVDPSITMGELTLQGKQAINYVRTRKNVGDQLNLSRLTRQQGFMEGFMNALSEKRASNENFAMDTYEDVSAYLVTDCSATVISSIVDRYGDYPLAEIVSLEGENILGEQYYEFYADEDSLDELILRLFYDEK